VPKVLVANFYAQKALISSIFLQFLYTFLTLFAFFYSFLHFFALFFVPILPNRYNLTPSSLFLTRQQGFALEIAEISPKLPKF